jgi:hypothetical protein
VHSGADCKASERLPRFKRKARNKEHGDKGRIERGRSKHTRNDGNVKRQPIEREIRMERGKKQS